MDLPGEPPKAKPAAPARGGTAPASTTSEWGTFSLVGLFVILALYALHEIKPFLLPLVLAVLVSLVLHPVHQALRRIRVPRLLAAALSMAGLLGLLGFGAYQLAVPGAHWLRSLDDKDLSAKLRETFRPMTRFGAGIREVADTVEQAAATEPPTMFENCSTSPLICCSREAWGTETGFWNSFMLHVCKRTAGRFVGGARR